MLKKLSWNISTLLDISFEAKAQRTEGHLLRENEV
jgi:hypothetical protein